jgi:hypothetical protein
MCFVSSNKENAVLVHVEKEWHDGKRYEDKTVRPWHASESSCWFHLALPIAAWYTSLSRVAVLETPRHDHIKHSTTTLSLLGKRKKSFMNEKRPDNGWRVVCL